MNFQGDPRLILGPSGSRLQFTGGQPLMDRGLENLVLISLFTQMGWSGNVLLGTSIGSDFEEATNQPITLQALNRIRDAAEKALDSPLFGTVTVTVLNPVGHRLDIHILIEHPGLTIRLTRDGGAWSFQVSDPAYTKVA